LTRLQQKQGKRQKHSRAILKMNKSSWDEDIELIQRYKKGDRESLEKIYFKYKNQLLKLIWYYVYNRQDAEDIMQMLFIKMIKGINKYKPYKEVKFKTWLFKAAINTAKDFLKKKKPEIDIEQIETLPDSRKGVEDRFAENEIINKIRKNVMRLPLKYKEAVSLRYFEDLPYNEIAYILKKPVGTIKSRINYAVNLLKSRLELEK